MKIRSHLRRLVRRIRSHWPNTRLTIRGDGHYGRPKVMACCEANGLDYIFGLPGNAAVDRLAEPAADEVRVRPAQTQAPGSGGDVIPPVRSPAGLLARADYRDNAG